MNPLRRLHRRARIARASHCAISMELLEVRQLLAAVAWDSGGDGVHWNDTLNWNPNVLPTSNDDVTISPAPGVTILHSQGTDSVRTLKSTVPIKVTGGSLTINGTSTISSLLSAEGGTLTLTNLNLGGSGSLSVAAGGTLAISNITFDVPVANAGVLTVQNTNTFNRSFSDLNGSKLQFLAGGNHPKLTIASGFVNHGTIELNGTNTFTSTLNVNSGTLTNAPDGVIRGQNGTGSRTIGASVVNQGLIDAQESLNISNQGFTFDSTAGTINVATGKVFTIDAGSTLLGSGTVLNGAGQVNLTGTEILQLVSDLISPAVGTQLALGGSTNGSVTVIGPGTLRNRGTLLVQSDIINAPFVNEGLLLFRDISTINGDFSNLAGSTLRMDAGGNHPNLTLASGFVNDGTIELNGTNGFTSTLKVNGGTLTNALDGVIRGQNGAGSRTIIGSIENQGLIDAQENLLITNQGGTFTSVSGTLNVAVGKILSIDGGTSILGSGTILSGLGQVNLTGSQTLRLTSDLINPAVGTQLALGGNVNGTVTVLGPGTLDNRGTLLVQGDIVNASLINEGLLLIRDINTINGSFANLPGSTLRMDAGGNHPNLTLATGFMNDGIIELNGTNGFTSTLKVNSGTLINAADGVIRSQNGAGSRTIIGSINNQGLIDIHENLLNSNQGGIFTSVTGTMNVAATKILTVDGGTSVLGSGTILSGLGQVNLTGTQTLRLSSDFVNPAMGTQLALGGSASGNVTINGPGLFRNRGTIALQNETVNTSLVNEGLLLIRDINSMNGSLVLQPGSTMRMDAGGNHPNMTVASGFVNHGLLEVNGTNGFTSTLRASSGILTNASDGIIRAQTGTGSRTINATLDNQGLLDVLENLTIDAPNAIQNNTGTIKTALGKTLTINSATLNQQSGTIGGAGTVDANLSIQVDGSGRLANDTTASLQIFGNLVGNTTNAALYMPAGALTFDGNKSSNNPQFLEVMSHDIGADPNGFAKNFAYGSVALANNTYVKLIDFADNSAGAGAEALYVNTLVVAATSTLDLNGVNIYARTSSLKGTIAGGNVHTLLDGGPLTFGTPTPGAINLIGETDDWNFFGRAGHGVTILLNPGATNPPAPLSPQLGFADVQLVDSSNSVIASANNVALGSGNPVLILGAQLPADGIYHIRIAAPLAQPGATGQYLLTAWDAAVDVQPLNLNQQLAGKIEAPYSVDRWQFSAVAGQQVQFDLVNAASSSIVFTFTGPNGFTAFTDSNVDSGLITFVDPGQYVLAVRGLNQDTGGYAFRLNETSRVDLALGTTYNGNFAGSGQAQLFRVQVPTAKPLFAQLDDSSNTDHNELYAKFGVPPTRSDFDARFSAAASPDQQLLVPNARAGTWYILAYGESVPAPSAYTLHVAASDVRISDVSPVRYADGGPVALTITGAGFDNNTLVSLVAADSTVYPATSVQADTFTQITATISLLNVPVGIYSVRVAKPGGDVDTLANVFAVTSAGNANLQTSLILPGTFGRHATATIYVNYSNTGNQAMPAPLLILQSADPDKSDRPLLTLDKSRVVSGFWTSAIPDGFSNSITILASGKTPGILQPGESVQLPVYYAGLQQPWDFSDTKVEFELRTIAANEPTLIDWNLLKPTLQPPTMDAPTWDAVYSNIVSQTGTTWGDYVRTLGDNAAYLGRLGKSVTDVGALWRFELQQAEGLNVIDQLASGVDAGVPTPGGLELSFGRVFGGTITQHYALGILGRGWSSSWDISLTKDVDGSIGINLPGGAQRRFQPDSRNGGYFAEAGDRGTLGATATGYKLTESNGVVTTFNNDGTLDYVQDANGNRITAAYTAGRLTSLTHSSGQSLTFAYNAFGRVASVTDSLNRTTTYTYDAIGEHLLSVQAYDGKITKYTYSIGQGITKEHALLSVEFSGGLHEFYTYDAQGRVVGFARDNNAEKLDIAYNGSGKVTVTDAAGAASQLYFDENGLLIKSVDPLGNATFSKYDNAVHLLSVTDALGQTLSYTYDQRGNVSAVSDELGRTTRFTYTTTLNQISTMTDAMGHVTSYQYDAAGNQIGVTYPNSTTERYNYDPLGDATSFVNRRGQTVSESYDANGKVTREGFFDGTHTDYTYDARSRLITATDSAGVTTFTYDTGDRLTKVSYPGGRTLDFTYDSAGRRIKMVDQSGFTTNYSYDVANRLAGLKDANNAVIVTYTYNAVGRLSRQDNANGTFTTYSYDMAGQVLSLINHAANSSINSRFDYTYDAIGQRTSMTTLDGAWTYTYDAAGQLTHAVFVATNPAFVNQDIAYSYDGVGNRTQVIQNGTTTAYTTNPLDQYTAVGPATYSYDADGNLISQSGSPQNLTYAYDSLNRLTKVTSAQDTWTYEYDAFGNRVASVHNGQRTEYALDPINGSAVVGEYNGNGSLIDHFTQGLGLTSRVDSNGAASYYDFDALGSTVGLSNSSGTYANKYSYLPFGESQSTSETIANPFQFSGQLGVMHESNGLHFAQARFYSSDIGRFTAIDPLRIAAPNLYAYAYNNPIQYVDPEGLDPKKDSGSKKLGKAFGDLGATYDAAVATDDPNELEAIIRRKQQKTDPNLKKAIPGFTKDAIDKIGIIPKGKPDKKTAKGAIEVVTDFAEGAQEGKADAARDIEDIKEELRNRRRRRPSNGNGPNAASASKAGSTGATGVSNSQDPNQKTGAGGEGAQHFVSPADPISYRIDFENDATATAPAQQVDVTDQLSTNLDWQTFALTEFGFGDQIISVPPHSQYYQTAVDMTFNGKTFQVQVEAGLNSATGKITARFQSIDPATSLPPDVLTGFLPPEDSTGRGMGHISYTINPKANLTTGVAIRNIALITFDAGETIATNQVAPHDPTKGTDPTKEALNTIDAGTPTSSVTALPASSAATFTLSWSGVDDVGGSGIATYDIYVSEESGPFTSFLLGATATSSQFTGVGGHTYQFYSVAHDQVGHVEAAPVVADTQTKIVGVAPSPFNVEGTAGNDVITVTDDATNVTVTINGGAPIVRARSSITTFSIDGHTGSDTLSFAGASSGTSNSISLTGNITIANDANGRAISAAGSTLLAFAVSQHLAALGLSSNATAQLLPTGIKVLVFNSLVIQDNAALDLTDGDLIVKAAGTTAAQLALTTITGLIGKGRNAGDWKGKGITSSAAASEPNKLTGIGIAGNNKGAGTPLYATFDGEPVDANSILVKYTYNGDADLSGKIDADDYFQIDSGFAQKLAGYRNGDFDFNGTVDADDYFLIDRAFVGQTGVLATHLPAASASSSLLKIATHRRARHHRSANR